MKTIVTTSGKVIQQGDGEGLIIASEDNTNVLEISEVSDDQVINLFGDLVRRQDKLITKNDSGGCGNMTSDFEILAERKRS